VLFLILQAEILENLRCQLTRQNAKQYCFIAGFKVGENFS